MLDIKKVSVGEYKDSVPDHRVFFNEPDFIELNKDKVDEVHYLLLKKDNSPKFGLILGVKDAVAKSPFSAPYAYPVVIGSSARVKSFDEAVDALEKYCIGNGIKELRFTLPPFVYDEDNLSVWCSALYRKGYSTIDVDINYTLDLIKLNNDNYKRMIPKKSRNHLRKAINSGIRIVDCDSKEDIQAAYDIILENHTAKGRPVHMTLESLKDTFAIVPHNVFLAELNDKPIAAMIYYEVSKDIVQCIYSGYLLEYSNSGVMNYLTWYAIQYYGNKGFKYIDRAIATEHSIPNYGLCDFKESVGCERSLKYTFRKKLKKG